MNLRVIGLSVALALAGASAYSATETEVKVETTPTVQNIRERGVDAVWYLAGGILLGVTVAAALTVIRRKIG